MADRRMGGRRELSQQHGAGRMAELMDMLKAETEHCMAETNTCKRERDEFELKCDAPSQRQHHDTRNLILCVPSGSSTQRTQGYHECAG